MHALMDVTAGTPMWLLSTDRAELHHFASPEDVKDGFATLSHVWNKGPHDEPEQSFQDVQRVHERCAAATDGTHTHAHANPRDFMCAKIRRCCELAQRHGYRWVWIDTCCIDKTSSVELSEAINSMFRYYALSRICYAYIRDATYEYEYEYECAPAPGDGDGDAGVGLGVGVPDFLSAGLQLGDSEWFQRGWTLQELIAPRFLLFLSQSWAPIGTKAEDRKSTRLNSSHSGESRMPSSA